MIADGERDMYEETEDGESYVREFIEQRLHAGALLGSVLAEFGIELENGEGELDVEKVRIDKFSLQILDQRERYHNAVLVLFSFLCLFIGRIFAYIHIQDLSCWSFSQRRCITCNPAHSLLGLEACRPGLMSGVW